MTEVNLTVREDSGSVREVLIQSKRFTIGRTPDNDLAIDNSNLSRRHAVIENFDGQVQITDCGSQNGTEVNGIAISPTTTLQDGDLITLAGVCDIEVSMVESVSESPVARQISSVSVGSQARPESKPAIGVRPASQTPTSFLSSPVFQAVAIAAGALVILGSIGLLVFMVRQTGDNRNSVNRATNRQRDTSDNSATPEVSSTPVTDGNANDSNDNSRTTDLSKDRIESAAIGVMHRLSTDDKTYSFSDKALQEIARKVNQYRSSSTLAANLASLQRSSAALNSLAREQGMEPGLLIFVVLANMEAHGGGDPKSVAQASIGDLLGVRATFGTNDADSSLIVLAAYKMGRGEKRSHPLLGTIRRLVRNPLTQRNVWFLNDHGGLEPEAYDFVLTVLALGVIAQSPTQFGVNSGPLVF